MPPNNDYTKDMRVTDGIVRRARVINLFGASGSRKSTLASGLHYELKKQWAQAEMAREFAKDVVHQETTHWFQQAILVLAEQSSRIQFIADKYDYVITDGPLMLASWYAPKEYPDAFHQLCRALFDGYENENFFLYRTHAYDSNGRLETEQEASDNEAAMALWLTDLGIPFTPLYSKDDNAVMLCDWLVHGKPLPPPEERPKISLRK